MIFMTHSASATMPMNSPASAVRMLAAVTLVGEHLPARARTTASRCRDSSPRPGPAG